MRGMEPRQGGIRLGAANESAEDGQVGIESGHIGPAGMGQRPHRSEATMHMDAQARKVGGRLSREDQRRLGDILQRVYDDVLRQGVPDRFKDLLSELEERKEGGEASMPSGNGQGEE